MQKIEFGSTGLVIEKNGFGCLPIQRISETEAVKLLHKACDGGINFFDTAKMDYFKKVRGNNMHWEDVTVVIANMNIDFYSPTRYFENVAVETQTIRLGDKSLTLVHRLVNTDDHQVKCVCSTVMVYLDPKTQQPATIPQYWRQAIRDYEGHDL